MKAKRTNQRKTNQGKTYGLTPTMLARIKAIRCDSAVQAASMLDELEKFTVQFIDHARCLAQSGQKDEARHWLRFFQNSKIIDLLAQIHDVAGLRQSLQSLRIECHPLDVPNWTTNIEAIRHCLQQILSHGENHKTNRRSANSCRTVSRKNGDGQFNFERSTGLSASVPAPLSTLASSAGFPFPPRKKAAGITTPLGTAIRAVDCELNQAMKEQTK